MGDGDGEDSAVHLQLLNAFAENKEENIFNDDPLADQSHESPFSSCQISNIMRMNRKITVKLTAWILNLVTAKIRF